MIDANFLKAIPDNPFPSIIVDGQGSVQRALDDSMLIAHTLTQQNLIEIIEPENDKKSISIDQTRELRKKVTLKSQHNNYRCFVINDMSRVGVEAQNTLLKTLEDLGQNITIIMPVASSDDVLKTIQSRSVTVSSNPTVSKQKDTKQYLIDNALLGYTRSSQISVLDVMNAAEFLKYSVSDRLHHYKNISEDKDKIMTLLLSLRVLCISTMRETVNHNSKIAWSYKVSTINEIIKKADSNMSQKLLLLGAATRL